MDRNSFFNRLFAFCEGRVELRALPSRKQAFFEIDDISGIKAFCRQHQKDDLYFGLGTRNGQAGTKENIVHIPCVWADVDFKEVPKEILGENIKKFPFKPSMVVRSGGGVHFYWMLKEPATKEDIPAIEDVNRRIAAHIQGDLNSCDAARILRIPGTINHKYPAKCELVRCDEYQYEISDFQRVLPETPAPGKGKEIGEPTAEWLSKAMRGAKKGERNATGTRIAGYWINKLPPKDMLAIMQAWNLLNNPSLPTADLESIVKSVSRYKADEPEKVSSDNIYDAKRMLEEYREHIKSLKKNRFITGITEIDLCIRGVAGGEVLTIIARAGSFKTAMLQNMLKNYVQHSSWAAVFFSLEMPISSLTERYHEILGGMTGKEVEYLYTSIEEGVAGQRNLIETDFIQGLHNLFVVPVRVSISEIVLYVHLIEQRHGVKVGVVGIDYLGLLDGPGVNEYELISRLSRDIKTTAKMLNIPLILLSQVSRKGGGGEEEISLDYGRGSGVIEEGADFVLGLWQAEREKLAVEDPEPDYNLICRILKNRKGAKGSRWQLDLDPKNLRIGADAEPWEPPKKKREKDTF